MGSSELLLKSNVKKLVPVFFWTPLHRSYFGRNVSRILQGLTNSTQTKHCKQACIKGEALFMFNINKIRCKTSNIRSIKDNIPTSNHLY